MQLSLQEEQRFQELCSMAFDFARRDDCDSLSTMLDAGLNINLKTYKGDSLLMLASYNNSLKTTKMLLERGAKVDEINMRGQTPLAGVCFKGYEEMAKLLIDHGADLHKKNGFGMSPYRFAILFGHIRLAKELKKYFKNNKLN